MEYADCLFFLFCLYFLNLRLYCQRLKLIYQHINMEKLKIAEMCRLSVEEFRRSEKIPLAVVLDNVRSLYNVGSVFRTCDAFRISELLLCGVSACPPNVEIHKTALGAEEAVSWKYFNLIEDAIAYLRNEGYVIFSVEQCKGSTMIDKAVKLVSGKRCAIVLGNEVKGVQQRVIDMSDGCVEIPQYGTKHSLNVAVATGIAVWEFFKALQPQLGDKLSQ